MKRLKYTLLTILGLITINCYAAPWIVEEPGPSGVIYTSAGNTGAYIGQWNGNTYNCTNLGAVRLFQGQTDIAGTPNPYPNGFPDGWFRSGLWSAADLQKWRYNSFYTHLPQFNEVNQFICQNTNNLAPNYTSNGVAYNCKYTPGTKAWGAGAWIVEESTCNGWTCNMRNLPSCNVFGCHWWGGGTNYCIRSVVQPVPPTPEPVIINDPCPSGSSSMNAGGKRMADSTSVGGSLCAQKLTVGFDANGVANSLITEHSTSSTQSISAAANFVNAVRNKGGADSTNIGGSLPNTVNYSDFNLGTNANGKTQIQSVSSGTTTVK